MTGRRLSAVAAVVAVAAALTVVGAVVVTSGASSDPSTDESPVAPNAAAADAGRRLGLPDRWRLPPAPSVGIVSRDREDEPLYDAYNVCYVNAFQTQTDEKAFWRRNPDHWALVLKKHGRPVIDGAWGEWLLDTRTPEKRHALARIVGRWVDGCADDGFDAVEYDNLDSWGRSRHLVTVADNIAFARLLTGRAHDAGLAAGAEERGRAVDGADRRSASTSRSPRSAGATTSAAPMRARTTTTCWWWSTATRTSTPRAPGGATGSRSCAGTSTSRPTARTAAAEAAARRAPRIS